MKEPPPYREVFLYNKHMKTNTKPKVKIDIDRIARLSQMLPSPALKAKLESQLAETVVHIEGLDDIDTSHITGTTEVTNLSNVLREDLVTASLTQEEALMNSKKVYNGLFMVEAVLPAE